MDDTNIESALPVKEKKRRANLCKKNVREGKIALKLSTELVPSTSWWNNLRKKISKSDWDTLRRQVYTDYGHKCGICDASGRLNCHEVWDYNDTEHIQTLVGFIALCDMCHHVKHLGLASILAFDGKLNYDDVIDHFCQVNNCSVSVFEKHRDDAMRRHSRRSCYEWSVRLGEYSYLVGEQLPIIPESGDTSFPVDKSIVDAVLHMDMNSSIRFGGYWLYLERSKDDLKIDGVYYLNNIRRRKGEYHDHWGKWCVFNHVDSLIKLAVRLSSHIRCGLIDNLKFNTAPSIRGQGECVMCVYCDDRDRDMVWFLLSGLGVTRKIWKYDRDS